MTDYSFNTFQHNSKYVLHTAIMKMKRPTKTFLPSSTTNWECHKKVNFAYKSAARKNGKVYQENEKISWIKHKYLMLTHKSIQQRITHVPNDTDTIWCFSDFSKF